MPTYALYRALRWIPNRPHPWWPPHPPLTFADWVEHATDVHVLLGLNMSFGLWALSALAVWLSWP